ncbi:MAG: hypothetical protein ACR5K9_07970 [Wolbachia sp.]
MIIRNLDFVKELVTAFNVSNYGSKVNTNFVVEGDNIVVRFNCDKGSAKQYLSQMARDLVREYFPDEYVAGHFFDLTSLPFNFDKGKWMCNEKGTKLTVPITPGVIFNLKMHFAEEFEFDVKAQMTKEIGKSLPDLKKENIKKILNENIKAMTIGKSSGYIKCLLFNDPDIQAHFEQTLRAQMNKYGHGHLDFYHIDGNKVYFKDIENIDFIKSVTEVSKRRAGYNFNFPSEDDLKVRKYKDAIGELIFCLTEIAVCGYYCDNFTDKGRISNGDNFAFIPVIKDGNSLRYLYYMEADKINARFSYNLLTDIKNQTKNAVSEKVDRIYAFSDRQIALLIPLIIENSVINRDGQLEINPELFARAVSRSPSTDMLDTQLEFPKCNQEEQIEEPPRRAGGTGVLCRTVESQRSLSAAEVGAGASVQEADIWLQQKDPWLSQGTREDKWLQSLQPGPSGLSQQRPSLWLQGGHSSRTSAWPQPMDPWSSPASSSNIPGFWSPAQVDSRDKPLAGKEEELIKALLYAFNLDNYILECPNTNFIVENGKIASSINDGVNVKEYLRELRDYTIKEYCGTEEEAKEGYDLNEFPFKFFSNCEKN